MQITIDRFEGEFAVVEMPDKTFINLPKALFENPKEGDVFDIIKNDSEKQKREHNIKNLMNKLFEWRSW